MAGKSRILLVGSGGIGTIAALNLEQGGLACVSAVLRSNYEVVQSQGFKIESCDHGNFKEWRPSTVLPKIPEVVANDLQPFDFVVCATKNIPDVPPVLTDLIRSAVTPGKSVILLLQNGLNIEKPFLEQFPKNVCLSGVSLCGANELSSGHITQDDHDRLIIGPFMNPKIDAEKQTQAAKEFVHLYSAAGKATCTYDDNVAFVRWRKLLYNAVWNPICALTNLDTTRLRLASQSGDPTSPVALLVRPAMQEIRAAALAAADVKLDESLIDGMIECDPIDIFCVPSMMQDTQKNRYIEYENILGEAIREGQRAGVGMPTVQVLYALCKSVQWRTMDAYGLVDTQKLLSARKEADTAGK